MSDENAAQPVVAGDYYEAVICPNCMHEFVAIPVAAQARITALKEAVELGACQHNALNVDLRAAQARIAALEQALQRMVAAERDPFWDELTFVEAARAALKGGDT